MGDFCFRILVFGLMSSFYIGCTDAVTDDPLICKDEASKRPCCLHVKIPMNWSEAYNFCHTRQGWLLNSLQPAPLNMSDSKLEQLKQLDILDWWSGLHIRQHRILADNFPVPNRLGDIDSKWDTSNIDGECIRMFHKLVFLDDSGRSTGRIRRQLGYNWGYVKKFTTCDDKLHFVCVFEKPFTPSKEGAKQPQILISPKLEPMESENYLFIKTNDFGKRADLTTKRRLTIKCVIPTTGQEPVIYSFGVPLPITFVNVDYGQQSWTPVSSRDYVQLYRCDVFDPKSNTVLQSPPVLVRYKDDVIFSAHVNFKETGKLSWALYKSSLLDSWPGFSNISLQQFDAAEQNLLASFWHWVSLVENALKLHIRPMIFVPKSGDEPAKLVMLVLKRSVNFDKIQNEQSKVITDYKNKIYAYKGIPTRCRCDLPDQPMVWQECKDTQPTSSSKCVGAGLPYKIIELNPTCDCAKSTSQTIDIFQQMWCSTQSDPVSVANFSSVVNNIKDIISVTTEPLEAQNISTFANIFVETPSFHTLPDNTIQNLMTIIDSINSSPVAALKQAHEDSNATQKILEGLENLGTQVELQNGHRRFVSSSMALEVWNLTYGDSVTQTVGLKIANTLSEDLQKTDVVTIKSENVDYGSVLAAISLQEEFITSLTTKPNGSDIRLIMKAYKETRLFETSSQQNNQTSSDKTNFTVNSVVMSMQLFINQQRQTDLGRYYVTLGFSPLIDTPVEQRSKNTKCVYWNLSASQGQGGWASDGCSYNRTEKGKDICTCNHLTNFAILMHYYDQDHLIDEHDVVLGIISIVGLSLSIFGLSLSILSFLLIKSLRDGLPQKMMFQLSLALLFSWILFLAGIQQTSSHTGCLVIAAVLHYLILSSFMWMLGQGILQHMLIVQVLKAVSHKFIIVYTVIAWGVPIIPVVAVLAIDTELYKGGKNYCWMKPKAFYYSFVLPVGLVVVTNIIIFIQIIIRLHKRGRIGERATQQENLTLVNVRASIISFCVLGLSWTFGFFAVEGARVYFQYLFCILVSMQGFLIFAMMIARNHRFQQYWKSVLSCCFREKRDFTTDSQRFITSRHRALMSEDASDASAQTYRTEIRGSEGKHQETKLM